METLEKLIIYWTSLGSGDAIVRSRRLKTHFLSPKTVVLNLWG